MDLNEAIELALVNLMMSNSIHVFHKSNNHFKFEYNDKIYDSVVLSSTYEISWLNDDIQENMK